MLNKKSVYLFVALWLLCPDGGFAQTLNITNSEIVPPSASSTAQVKGASTDAAISEDAEATVKYVPQKKQKEVQEEEDDNSAGSVVHFKFVDDKVVFEEDKEREILVYYRNFSVSKGIDGLTRCSLRLYVLNDLEERVNNLSLKIIWPKISTALQYTHMKPGVSRYNDITLLGEGCFTMDKTPTIEVNRCRVKGMSEEKCADKVKWFQTRR